MTLLDHSSFKGAYDDTTPNLLYAATTAGFYYSRDNGGTWRTYNRGLLSLDVRHLVQRGNRIFLAVWGSGLAVINKNKLP